MSFQRVILIVLDSLGVGAAPDASRFGDQSAHTLRHISEWCEQNGHAFALPNMSRWGLSQIFSGYGIQKQSQPSGATAILEELSPGKDTTTGHWEMAGTVLKTEFPVYEQGFPTDLIETWCEQNQLSGYLGNKASSGTTILDELGEEHIRSGKPIVYTSADSVFQVAASEEFFGLERLYKICESARKLLDPLGIGRIIARPFLGTKTGAFQRTENRRDYSVPPPQPNLLDLLVEENYFVAGVGKIEDIFAHRSVTLVNHTGRNETSLTATLDMIKNTSGQRGLIFTNLIDFDQLHGHRRNPRTYADALVAFDQFLPQLEEACSDSDLMILTADHGNDPTHSGTDHTRENVPLLLWSKNPGFNPKNLGTLKSFATIARLTLECLKLDEQLSKIPDAKNTSNVYSQIWNSSHS